jgi:hypothetical protein
MMRHRAVVDVLNILLVVAVLVQGFVPAARAGDFWIHERGAPEVGTAQSGLMDIPAAATSKLPIAQQKVPDLADTQRLTLAQAGTPVPDQKKRADCAALEQDLFIDLKEVVKAGCTPSQAQIAKLLDNPVGNFVAVPFQYDYVTLEVPQTGETKTLQKLQITPTFPLSLGSDWNLINRVVFPFFSAPINKDLGNYIGLAPGAIISDPSFPGVLTDPYDRTNGFGDMVYVGVVSPKKPIKIESTGGAVIWGIGATSMFPTASEDVLGTGKYSLGPAAVAAYLGPEWLLGVFPQHWWSVGGDSSRSDVSLTNIQYFLYYAPPWDPKAQWRIGMSPNISINWTAEGDKVTLPVGMGIGRMFEIGKLPVRIQLEVDYSVIHPDDKIGSRWDFRLYFTPVIPTFLF